MTLRVFDERYLSLDSSKKKTYGDHVLRSLELPKSDINGDTTLTLSLEFVQDPG